MVIAGSDDGPGPAAAPGWRWDVALSFAGAQRAYVEQVAAVLKARGVRCFYDADEQIDLWGKYLAEELPAIYGEQAATVVMFVSAEYAARDWTRHERRAALNRAIRERREYVLPARFDDTPLPGLPSDMVTVDLRTRTPQRFAAMIADKLAALAIATPEPPAAPDIPALIRECLLRPPQPERLFVTQPDLPEEDAQVKEVRKAQDTHQLVELEKLIAVWQWGDSWLRSRPDSLVFTSHGIRIVEGRRRLYIPYGEFRKHTFSCGYIPGHVSYAVNEAPREYLVIKGPNRWKSPKLGKPLDTHLVAEDLNRIKEIAADHPGA